MFGGVKKKDLDALEAKQADGLKNGLKALESKLELEIANKITHVSANVNRAFDELTTMKTDHTSRIELLESQMVTLTERINAILSTCDNERLARNDRFKETENEIGNVRKYIDEFEQRHSQTEDKVYSNIGKVQHAAEELEHKVSRISDAITGDFFNLAAYREEKDRDTIQHRGNSVEWIIKNVSQKIEQGLEGHAILSPTFTANVPTVGEVADLQLAFYPRGDRAGGCCSLYLHHPVDAPWMRFCLTVGSQKRGPFDTIYKGPPNFCTLAPEINEGLPTAWDAVRLSVEFITPLTGNPDALDELQEENHTRRSFAATTYAGLPSLRHPSSYLCRSPPIGSSPLRKWPSLLT